MNRRSHHEHHQEVVVDVDPPLRRPGHHRWTEIIHPAVSVIVASSGSLIVIVTWLTWAIAYRQDFISSSIGLMHALGWIILIWLGCLLIEQFIRRVLHPLVALAGHVVEVIAAWHARVVLARAERYAILKRKEGPEMHQVTEERTTYNLKGDLAQAQISAPEPEQPRILPARSLYLSGQLLEALQHERLLLGAGENGRILGIAHKKFFSTISSGIPSSGKTTSCYWLAVQLILLGARIIPIDPHMNYQSDDGEKSLTQELEPFKASFVFPPIDASSSAAIMQRVKWMKKQIMQRQQPGYIARASDTLLLIIDEFNTVAELEEIRDELAADLSYIQREGRKYYVHTMLLGHRWSQQDIGKVNIRTVASTIMAHKQNDENQAGLLVGKANVKKVLALSPGQYLFKSINPTTDDQGEKSYDLIRIQTPMISAADADWVMDLQRQIATSEGTSRPTTGPLPTHFQAETMPPGGSGLNEPGKPLEVESDPDLPAHLLAKMYTVLELDAEGTSSQKEIIAQTWGPEYADGRKFYEAQDELKLIRKAMAGQLRKRRGA